MGLPNHLDFHSAPTDCKLTAPVLGHCMPCDQHTACVCVLLWDMAGEGKAALTSAGEKEDAALMRWKQQRAILIA